MKEDALFDPREPQYQSFDDLPENQRRLFAETPDKKGFVRRDARFYEEIKKYHAENLNQERKTQKNIIEKIRHTIVPQEDHMTTNQDLMHAEALKIDCIKEVSCDADGHVICMMQDGGHTITLEGDVQKLVTVDGHVVRPAYIKIERVVLDDVNVSIEKFGAYQQYYGEAIMDRLRMDQLRRNIAQQ